MMMSTKRIGRSAGRRESVGREKRMNKLKKSFFAAKTLLHTRLRFGKFFRSDAIEGRPKHKASGDPFESNQPPNWIKNNRRTNERLLREKVQTTA